MKVTWKTLVHSMVPERSNGARSEERFNIWWRGRETVQRRVSEKERCRCVRVIRSLCNRWGIIVQLDAKERSRIRRILDVEKGPSRRIRVGVCELYLEKR